MAFMTARETAIGLGVVLFGFIYSSAAMRVVAQQHPVF